MMLNQLKISNFKCFRDVAFRFARLNLLCGLNGMGKSTVIQALLMLRQSYQTGHLRQGRLVLHGALVDLGLGSDVLFEEAEDEVITLGLRTNNLTEEWYQSFDYSPTGDQLSSGSQVAVIPDELACVPPLGGQLVYVQAERLGPQKLYPLSQVKAEMGEFGKQSELAWNVLHSRQGNQMRADDARCENLGRRRLIDVVDYWLQDVIPGTHLRLRSVPDADAMTAGFTFDRQADVETRRYRAMNVGFGLSYVVPVVLGLLSEPSSLCLIENPEAHLHPRGQTRLAELAVRAASAGVQLLIETHSDHFLDGVRIAVREGLIAPDDVSIHYFERSSGATMVSSPVLDDDGRLSRWPADFFSQYEENLVRLLGPRGAHA